MTPLFGPSAVLRTLAFRIRNAFVLREAFDQRVVYNAGIVVCTQAKETRSRRAPPRGDERRDLRLRFRRRKTVWDTPPTRVDGASLRLPGLNQAVEVRCSRKGFPPLERICSVRIVEARRSVRVDTPSHVESDPPSMVAGDRGATVAQRCGATAPRSRLMDTMQSARRRSVRNSACPGAAGARVAPAARAGAPHDATSTPSARRSLGCSSKSDKSV